jgi:hypothetical protein
LMSWNVQVFGCFWFHDLVGGFKHFWFSITQGINIFQDG